MSIRQRRQQLCEAAARGDLVALEVAVNTADCLPTAEVLESAAAANQLPACEWLRERSCPWGGALITAARHGHLSICEWLLANGCPWVDEAAYTAARGGHMGLVEWLLLRPFRSDRPNGSRLSLGPLLEAVAEGCELALLRLLHRSLLQGEQQALLLLPAENPRPIGPVASLPVSPISPLWSNGQAQPRPLTPASSLDGPIPHSTTVQRIYAVWLRSGGAAAAPDGSELPAMLAAASGSPTPDWRAKVEWLEGLGFSIRAAHASASTSAGGSFTTRSSIGGIGGGGGSNGGSSLGGASTDSGLVNGGLAANGLGPLTDIVPPPHRHPRGLSLSLSRTPHACARAAALPNAVERLTWLRTRGYPADVTAVEAAAGAGNLEAVEYLLGPEGVWGLGSGPGFGRNVTRAAAAGGHLAVLKALHARGYSLADCLGPAARSGQLEVMSWLVGRLAVAPAHLGQLVVRPALQSGCVPLVEWLHAQGCRVGFEEAVAVAAAGGHLDLALWALEAGWMAPMRPAMEPALFTAAAALGSVELLTRLRERGCPMPLDGEPYVLAGRNGDLATLRCLRQLGCPFGSGGFMFTRCVYDTDFRQHLYFFTRHGCGSHDCHHYCSDNGSTSISVDGDPHETQTASASTGSSPSRCSSFCCTSPPSVAGCTSCGSSCSVGGASGCCRCYCPPRVRDSPLGVLQWLIEAGYPVDLEAAREAASHRSDSYHVVALLKTSTRMASSPR